MPFCCHTHHQPEPPIMATASATVDPDRSPPLRLNSIPAIDLRLLTQSELYSLSNCSNSSLNIDPCDGVVTPKIDRSVFNESAGSRKQTYSRLRLAPAEASKTTIHRRTTRLRASSRTVSSDFVNDSEHAENSQIITVLKELFKSDSNSEVSAPIDVENGNVGAAESLNVEGCERLKSKAPELLNSEAPESLNSDAPESLNAEVPEMLNTESVELLNAKPREVLPAEGSESLNSEAPESLNSEAPGLLNAEAPQLLNNKPCELLHTEPPELLNTEPHSVLDAEAPEMLNPEAPVMLSTEVPELSNTEVPELLNTEAPELSKAEGPELSNTEVPALSNNGEPEVLLNTDMKRKRGRPRKHENADSVRPPAAKRTRTSTVKKVVVYDDDKDKELMNSRDMEVNLVDLGRLEDPYGPEIRRRTEGLSNSDELLGFLRGLNGQWGTTRKKRRIVDASDFGDALPKGWKLSLCIKKKEGRVWLFCRRYISPGGRQFESCKDISVYLRSIFGEESMDKPNHTPSNNCDDSAFENSSGNVANLYVQETVERSSPVQELSSPLVSLPTDCEKQLTPVIMSAIAVHADVFKCLKCFLIFETENDLFDHRSLSHKDEKSQLASSIPDWSIVVGGIFECRFCHKSFYEVNQYNGHIGTHVPTENKIVEKTIEPVLVSPEIDHEMSFVMENKKIDEVAHDLDMNEDVLIKEIGDEIGKKRVNDYNAPETEEPPEASVSFSKSDSDFDQDVFSIYNGQDSGSETMVQSSSICEEKGFQANINDANACSLFDKLLATEKDKPVCNEQSSGFFHGDINDIHMSTSFEELDSEKGKVVNNESSSGILQSDGHDAVFGNRGQTSSFSEEKGFQENINDTRVCGLFDELASEKGKAVNKESSSSGAFHGISNSQDTVSETRVQTSSIREETGFQEKINDTHIFGPFNELSSVKGKIVNKESSSSGVFHGSSSGQGAFSDTRAQTPSIREEADFREKINDTQIFSPFGELTSLKGKVINKDSSSSEVFHGISNGQDAFPETRVRTSSNHEEMGFREKVNDARIFSSFGQLTPVKGQVVNKDSSSSGIFHNRFGLDQKFSESESLSLFSNRSNVAVDNSSYQSSKKQDSVQKLGFAAFSQVSHGFGENRLSYNSSSSKLDEPYEVRNSDFDRYKQKEHANLEELSKLQVFRNNQSINNEVSSLGSSSQNALNANVMGYNTGKNIEFNSLAPTGHNNQAFGFQDGLKFDDDIFGDKFDENIHELSLAFGNPNSLYEDTVNEQKKDRLNGSSVVPSKINDTFDVQTDLSMVNNSMVQNLKRENESRGFQSSGNSVYSGRTWGDYKVDEFRNPEDKRFLMGSGSNQMWKTAQGNHLQSGLVNPHAQIQSPHFHSFDIMSQKAQDGLLRHNERYNPSRSEPVEFRFLTDRSEHNPHSLQPGPRVLPYIYNNPGMDQGFESTNWMGKNVMVPNMSGRNVMTASVCALCRNAFHLPAIVLHQQTQAGVASLCPNCSAGFSGQINML